MEHEDGQTLFNSENKVYFDLQNTFAISPDTAVRLSRELKTEAEYWINLQKEYDIDIARKTL